MEPNVLSTASSITVQGGPTTPSTTKEFEEEKFMKDLIHLRDSQEAIQGLSGWCIRNRKNNAYKIARCWLKCIKKVKVEQKLTLFHLLNDIVQHSKKRNYDDLLDKFQTQIREAMPHLKNTKITEKVIRCLSIWSERQVFEDKFVQELITSIDPSQNREEQEILDNFQPQQLCTQIKIMKALEDDTDYKLRTVKDSELNLMEMDEVSLRQNLKDRKHGNDYINDVEEGQKRLEQYIKAIDRELTKRRQVIEMLTHAGKYYNSLLGEANIVATAYTNFGKRVKNLHRKLEERMEEVKDTNVVKRRHISGASSLGDGQAAEFLEDISPVPSPDYDAPSPQADELELQLPDDTNVSLNAVSAISSSETRPSLPRSPKSTFSLQQTKLESSGSLLSGGSDLNSRLDSIASDRLKDFHSYSSANFPQNFGESTMSKVPSTLHPNMSSTLSATTNSANGSKHEFSQSSSGFSISEYLTKLAKGGDAPSQQNYQQETASHLDHFGNKSMTSINAAYTHPPPTQTNAMGAGSQPRPIPQSSDGNWWPRQQPPPQRSNPPPLTAWSREGDPPPATSWPAPRPDVWSSGNTKERSANWGQSSTLDPVPEWQLPVQEEEPPDNEPTIYNNSSSEILSSNLSLSRTHHKSDSMDIGAFGDSLQNRERRNSSNSSANNLISLTRDNPSEIKNNSQQYSAYGSHNSSLNKIVQPPPHSSHQSTHLVHDDMEMCSDEEDESEKISQFDNFGYNKFDPQRPPTNTGGMPSIHKIPPMMSEEEFNHLKYNAPNPIAIPAPADPHSMPVNSGQNGLTTGAGPFSNPPPSFTKEQPTHNQFSSQVSQPSRVNPYLSAAPKELTQQEQEEEKKTQSLQDRLRSLAGVPVENKKKDDRQENFNSSSSYQASNGQDNYTGSNVNNAAHGFRGGGSGSSHVNEHRGGLGGSSFGGHRGMVRPIMGGNGSWRGSPRPATPMRGVRGMNRGRGPRW